MSPTATQLGIDPEAIEAALDRNMTFPARWYSDPAIFDVELEHVFARSWQLVAHEARIPNPGDHHVCRVAHVPVLLTRDLEGELHGFVNVCRHRAFPVATEDGNRKTLQCQYHGWTYELDGCLRKAPRSEREPGFDASEFSLVPVAVEVFRGFVFVNPDVNAPPLAEAYPELADLWTSRHLDFADYRYIDRYTYEIPANWKVWVENATECYHCPTVHKNSFSDAWEVDVDVYEYVNVGGLLAQFTPVQPAREDVPAVRRERRRRHDRPRLPLRLHVADVVLRGRRLRRVPGHHHPHGPRELPLPRRFLRQPGLRRRVRRGVDRDVQPHARRGRARPCSCSSPGCDPGWFRTAG